MLKHFIFKDFVLIFLFLSKESERFFFAQLFFAACSFGSNNKPQREKGAVPLCITTKREKLWLKNRISRSGPSLEGMSSSIGFQREKTVNKLAGEKLVRFRNLLQRKMLSCYISVWKKPPGFSRQSEGEIKLRPSNQCRCLCLGCGRRKYLDVSKSDGGAPDSVRLSQHEEHRGPSIDPPISPCMWAGSHKCTAAFYFY